MPRKNVFRTEYRELTPDEINALGQIKEKAEELHELLELAFNANAREVAEGKASSDHFTLSADPRCMAASRTKLEEAVMWAVKGITAPPAGPPYAGELKG